jgi:RNA polymerase sigma-70 factor (ECF subfamily)
MSGGMLERLEARLKALMCAALAGDAESYRRLLTELSQYLRAYFIRRIGRDRRSDAEDLVQETLIAVDAKRATYDARLPFTPWLHAIARYKLIDHFRREGRSVTVPIDDAADVLASTESEDAAEARLDLSEILQELPTRSRLLVQKVKIEGRSIGEVAASTGMSASAIKVSLHRTLKALARKLRGP